MKLKIGYYYNVQTRIPPVSLKLAKLVQTGRVVSWYINGYYYDFDFWETDGVAWNK